MGDHYLTLGVDRAASEREIARGYRRLARRYHPDVSTAPALTLDLFLAVRDAYETLSGPCRRASYDAELRRREQLLPPPPTSAVARPVRAPSRIVVGEMREDERPRPDAYPSTMALVLVAAAAVALVAAVALEDLAAGGTRFLWAGACVALGVIASTVARWLAARQLEQLLAPDRSRRAKHASQLGGRKDSVPPDPPRGRRHARRAASGADRDPDRVPARAQVR